MVYDADTFEVLHGLTQKGQDEYQKLLDEEADRIIFKSKHPVKYMISIISEFFSGK